MGELEEYIDEYSKKVYKYINDNENITAQNCEVYDFPSVFTIFDTIESLLEKSPDDIKETTLKKFIDCSKTLYEKINDEVYEKLTSFLTQCSDQPLKLLCMECEISSYPRTHARIWENSLNNIRKALDNSTSKADIIKKATEIEQKVAKLKQEEAYIEKLRSYFKDLLSTVPEFYKKMKIKEEDKLHAHDGLEIQIKNEILSEFSKDDKNIFNEISSYIDKFETCCNKREPNEDIQNAYNELLKFMKKEKIRSFFKKIELTNYLSYLKIENFKENNEIKKDENIKEKNQDNFNIIHRSNSVNYTRQSSSTIGRKLLSESVNKQYYHLSWFKKLLKLLHMLE